MERIKKVQELLEEKKLNNSISFDEQRTLENINKILSTPDIEFASDAIGTISKMIDSPFQNLICPCCKRPYTELHSCDFGFQI